MSATQTPEIAIVVPTIREDSLAKFLTRWQGAFDQCLLIVVEDNPERSFAVPEHVHHYSWTEIDATLGSDSWIIPRRSDCVRSFGYYTAYRAGCRYVWTLDDDCYPEATRATPYLTSILTNLETLLPSDRWWNTLRDAYPRGYPYEVRDDKQPVAIHHGLWSHIPDLDALTQVKMPNFRTEPAETIERVPTGRFYPMCGMNLAFRRELIPAMYFLLMGQDGDGKYWEFDRFGDIWAGIFTKRICDHLGWAVSSGAPSVHHDRASSVDANLRKERPGYPINEMLWKRVLSARLIGGSVVDCYDELADHLEMTGEYWDTLRRAMHTWASLFR